MLLLYRLRDVSRLGRELLFTWAPIQVAVGMRGYIELWSTQKFTDSLIGE
jgi:hypothetical protein